MMQVYLRYSRLIPVLFCAIGCLSGCTTAESAAKAKEPVEVFKPDGRNSLIDNEWLNLQNVGYAIKGSDVIWTAGGLFKVDSVREIIVNDFSDLTNKKLLFSSQQAIPTGVFMAESKPLRGKELDWLKAEGPTSMYVEVVLVDLNGNKKALYTPIGFSAASKKTIRTVLTTLNPKWNK
jgi:hypothetical protein